MERRFKRAFGVFIRDQLRLFYGFIGVLPGFARVQRVLQVSSSVCECFRGIEGSIEAHCNGRTHRHNSRLAFLAHNLSRFRV